MPRLLHHISVRYQLDHICSVLLSENMLIRTISRCFDVRFALWDLENAVTKKVAVLIFGIF